MVWTCVPWDGMSLWFPCDVVEAAVVVITLRTWDYFKNDRRACSEE